MKIKPHKNYYICNQPNINSHSLMMKQLIACCGLDCESCDARIATVRDDNELRITYRRLRQIPLIVWAVV